MRNILVVISIFALMECAPIDQEIEYNKNFFDEINTSYYGGLKGAKLNSHIHKFTSQGAFNATSDIFLSNFNKIQIAAAQLVAIQEASKHKPSFSEEDNKYYADSLLELGIAAQKLADLQHNQNVSILDYVNSNQSNSVKEPAVENDTVLSNSLKTEASVAESKPIGLSISGIGGLASAKPNAVAIAGQDGLSVAAPKGTAIAGVSPEDLASLGINLPNFRSTR